MTDLITTVEAAALLGVSRPRVAKLIQEGRLAAEKRGRDLWLKRTDVENLERRPVGKPKKDTTMKTETGRR